MKLMNELTTKNYKISTRGHKIATKSYTMTTKECKIMKGYKMITKC